MERMRDCPFCGGETRYSALVCGECETVLPTPKEVDTAMELAEEAVNRTGIPHYPTWVKGQFAGCRAL